jgi:hypothetical protein
VKLPQADRAVVDERKVREYLLSRAHPIGRFKAAFFARAGFEAENWSEGGAPRLVTVYPR